MRQPPKPFVTLRLENTYYVKKPQDTGSWEAAAVYVRLSDGRRKPERKLMESVDQKVLKELIGKRFPVEDFETELEKIMKKKSSAKLLISNRPDTIKGTDGKYHAVNYKCVPQSKSCRYLFCFLLKHENGMVWIKNGYLEKL